MVRRIVIWFFTCALAICAIAQSPYLQHRRTVSRPAAGGGGGGSIPPGIDSNQSTATEAVADSSLTWSHTVPSGANRCLVIMLGMGDGMGTNNVTTITFNGGGTFTQVVKTNGSFCITEMWCMTNPPVTTANIVVTFAGPMDSCGAAGVNLTNVQQVTSPFSGGTGKTGTSFAPSVDITSSSIQLPLSVLSTDQQGTLSVTTGTQLWEFESMGGDVDAGGATVTGAATSTITWATDSSSGENAWCLSGVSFIAP